jgi:PAS domain S-box-containing protein
MRRGLSKPDRAKLPSGSFSAGFYAVLSFLFLAAVIITLGTLYYQTYATHFRQEAGSNLLAIADLKINELSQWRKERMGDGEVFYNNPVFSRLVRRFFEKPGDDDAREQLQSWLGKVQGYYQYEKVFLLDTHAVERLSIPAGGVATGDIPEHVVSALDSGRVTLMGIHRHTSDHPIILGVLVPVFHEADPHRPLGVLVLQIDPNHHLYPLLQRWPVPSETAETLIVRRDGNEVLFLNDLRFQTNAALNLRIPLTQTDLPAVKAVLGHEGLVEGVDYRNEPVLAALKAIPDSPWFMVARQDIAEIYAPVKARLWEAVVMTVILLFGSAAGIGLVWRHQRVRFYRQKVEAAEKLESERQLLSGLIEASPDSIYFKDRQGHFLRINQAFAKLLKLESPAAAVGKTDFDFFGEVHANQTWEDERRIITTGEPLIGQEEREDWLEEGRVSWVSTTKMPMYDQHGQIIGVMGISRNITERKEAMQKLVETTENLKVSNRDLEQFAYIASHDLQEPLRMVANYMQLLERRYKDQLDQDAKDFIGFAVDGAVRMQQLIDSLLDYSRLQTRKHPFEPVDLNAVLQRVLRDLEGRILETGATITADLLPQLRGDGMQLGLVFQNFIGNALKFKGDKAPEIQISAEEFSDHWKIAVRDNGIGIAPEHQARIFKIFQRLHSRAEYPGTGIGLAICRRIIERHDGETGVESEFTKGSTFWFTLPKRGKS